MAQLPYFNEWFQGDKYYVKIKVPADGLYRVSTADLAASGSHGFHSIVSGNLQLYYRGQEVPIYIHDSLNGNFDYFEFYGRRNDGAIDSLMYRRNVAPYIHDASRQPNLFTSFYSDTSAYFLTWDGTATQRISDIYPTAYSGHVPEPHYRARILQEYMEDYFYGGGGNSDWENRLNPDWITGEGMVSNEIFPTTFQDALSRLIYTPSPANSGNPAKFKARVFGVNNSPSHITSIDLVLFGVGSTEVLRDTFYGIEFANLEVSYPQPLPDSFYLRFHANGTGTPTDFQRVAWATVDYDRTFALNGRSEAVMREWNHADTTYLRFEGAGVDSAAWIYDLTRKERIEATVSGDTLKFLVPGHPGQRELYMFTDRAIRQAPIDATPRFAGITDDSLGAEFVIITHEKFANSAQRYAAYRDSNTVNRLRTKVVFIDEIFNEFGYGSYTPWAIKNFCRYTLEQWTTKPQHFLIWGKGRTCPRCAGETENYIPVSGNPSNDLEYVSNMRLDEMDLVPLAGMGRVSIMTDEQGLAYLEKVNQYEHGGLEAWNKEVLFMGGGANDDQQDAIHFYIADDETGYATLWQKDPLNGRAWTFQKRNNGFESNDDLTTEGRINKGVALLQYFGHGSTSVFELDVLEPNRYRNYGKYPMMFSFGCSGGDYTVMPATYGERFILEPGKGGIGFLGNTTTGDLQTLAQYGQAMYAAILDSAYGRPFGEVMRYAIEAYTVNGFAFQNIYAANHAKQMNFQGDPSITMHLPSKPDLRVKEEDLYFPDGMPGALESQYRVNLILHNDGRSFEDSFQVFIKHQLPGTMEVLYSDSVKVGPFATADTLELTVLNPAGLSSVGYNRFTVSVDPVDFIDEYTNANNSFQLDQLFVGKVANPILPQEFAIVSDATVALMASSYQMLPSGPLRYLFEIDTVSSFDSPFKKTSPAVNGTSAIGEWPIPFAMEANRVYWWRSRLADVYPERWLASSFKYVPGRTGWSQGTVPQLSRDVMEGLVFDTVAHEWRFDYWTAPLHAYIQASGKA
ncbi:MAG: C25 family cysteine peptidase, partial [Bacteroidia bacterium]